MIAIKELRRRAWTINEFSAMFGVSPDTSKRLIAAGLLDTILVSGRRLIPNRECERVEKEGIPSKARRTKHEVEREAR